MASVDSMIKCYINPFGSIADIPVGNPVTLVILILKSLVPETESGGTIVRFKLIATPTLACNVDG
jgi:hypothetical protein